MIHNQSQFELTVAAANEFRKNAAAMRAALAAPGFPGGSDERVLYEASVRAVESQVVELDGEVREWHALRRGRLVGCAVSSWSDLPAALVRARIARGWNECELGSRMEPPVPWDVVRQREAQGYQLEPFHVLMEVATLLDVTLEGSARFGGVPEHAEASAVLAVVPLTEPDVTAVPSSDSVPPMRQSANASTAWCTPEMLAT